MYRRCNKSCVHMIKYCIMYTFFNEMNLIEWIVTQALSIIKFSFSLFTCSKQKWLFWRAGFFPANQGFWKTFQTVLIGWIKAGFPKKPRLLRSCKQVNYTRCCIIDQSLSRVNRAHASQASGKANITNTASWYYVEAVSNRFQPCIRFGLVRIRTPNLLTRGARVNHSTIKAIIIKIFVMLQWCYYVARVFNISTLSGILNVEILNTLAT